ncbi:MAG TPA: PP2C family serine/threonine-protein phosphatase [Vicinamibacterales bacterium]|nr:PP2C family serine/threonine-protein phosphatase [Vicinamibacterales bacterium]
MDDPNTSWRSVLSHPIDIEHFQPLSSAAMLEIDAVSAAGALRSYNTDHFLAVRLSRTQETLLSSLPESDLPPPFSESGYFLVVADGLGDRGSGARASRVALSTLAHLAIRYGKWNLRIDSSDIDSVTEQGEFFYRRAHDAMLEARRAHPMLADMAVALTAMYVVGGDLFFAHVGHAKGFLFRDGNLVQLTIDHTLDPERPDENGSTPPARYKNDFAHQLTDVVGGTSDPRIDIEHFEIFTGDRLLLCTNGLTDALSAHDIASVLALQRRPTDDCQRLLELARAAHAADDVTVLVADYRLQR